MNAAWPTARDLAGLPGLPTTDRGVRMRAASEAWGSAMERAPGGHLIRYNPAHLPAETRLALASRCAAHVDEPHGTGPDAKPSAAQTEPRTKYQIAPGSTKTAKYTAQLNERDKNRTRVLVLFQRWWQTVDGQLHPALESFVIAWNAGKVEADQALKEAFPRLALSTVRKWWLDLQARGTLARNAHPKRGQFTALEGDLGQKTLAILASRPHLHAAAVRSLLIKAGVQNVPSERAFQRAINHFKTTNAAGWLAHTNPDAWRSHYMAASGDAAEHIKAPNEEWQMDSTVGDVMLVDPETGEIRRHHIIAVIDVFTRRAMFLITRTSRANAIMALIRRAIAAWGMPTRIKTDNGQDYTAETLEFALLQLGIEHPLCEPFQPQQKPFVERVFGTLLHSLFPLLTGFIGHSVEQRKAIESAKSFADRIKPRHPEQAQPVELRLSPDQLQRMVDNWTADYLAEEHSSLGCSPNQRTADHLQRITRADARALDLFLVSVALDEVRKVVKKGIPLDNGWYTAGELGGLEGERVRCRMSDDEIGEIHVFDLDGAYICKAVDTTRLGVSLREVSAKRQANQKRATSDFKAKLREANKAFDTNAAVRQVYLEREQAAVEQAVSTGSVQRMPVRELAHTTPAIESALQGITAAPQQISDAAQAAMQRLEAGASVAAPVFRVGDSPNERYSLWCRLNARVAAGQALKGAERDWFEVFSSSAEWRSMNRLHQGQDPFAAEAGG